MKAALTAVIRMTVFATKDNTMTKIKIKGRMIAMSDSGNAVGSIAPCHHQHMSRGATSTHAMKTCGTDVRNVRRHLTEVEMIGTSTNLWIHQHRVRCRGTTMATIAKTQILIENHRRPLCSVKDGRHDGRF